MRRNYKITTKSLMYILKDLVLMTILHIFLVLFIAYHLYQNDFDLFVFLAGLSTVTYFAISILPVLLLLNNYFLRANVKSLLILDNGIKLDDRELAIEDIEVMKVFATYQYFDGHAGVTALPYNPYFYFIELIATNGDVYILTSLLGYSLDRDLRKYLASDKIKEIIKGFPMIDVKLNQGKIFTSNRLK